MRSKILLSFLLTVLFVLANGCGSVKNCPVCGTTKNDGYAIIDIVPVPEHNPTGEPGGPFNSFDISVADSINHRFYVSDRIGLDIPVFDTVNNIALMTIEGANGVASAGNVASPCVKDAAGNDVIPPLLSAFGNLTRYGCRTFVPGGVRFSLPGGFGPNGLLGGFPGAQCCAARANGVNPLSGPDGEQLTPDGNFLFTGNGSSSVVVFDLTTMNVNTNPPTPPTVIAAFPTGQSADYDGCTLAPCGPNGTGGILNPNGISPCIASANGRAFSDPTCGDLRADEMSYDPVDQILLVANGDPGLPFVTFIDMSHIVGKTGTLQQQHCLPVNQALPYGPTYSAPGVLASINFPSCILGQIYYDGSPVSDSTIVVDTAGAACPDPSLNFQNGNPVPSGVSGTAAGVGGANVPCHHGPIIDISTGTFDPTCNPALAGAICTGAISPAGIGGSAFNPNTGHFLVANSNSTGNLTIGSIDEINPKSPNGPVVINSFPVPNCMPSGIVQGPGNNFLVTCADHDGEAFPPNEYVIDGSTGAILATITSVGGVDEAWYNPGDNRYYLAARDMPQGPVLGVIDAKTNQWLQNVGTNANSHSVAVDSTNNHVWVPMQSGGPCGTQSSNGCIGVFAQQ